MLVEYVRNGQNQKIGVVVALDKDQIGWSEKHRLDKNFDKTLAIKIAKGRAIQGTNKFPVKKKFFVPAMRKMQDRAERYFKE